MPRPAILAALLLAAAPLMAQSPAIEPKPYSREAEATYKARFEDIATSGKGELSAYAPLEAIQGAPPKRLPPAKNPAITPAALDAAQAYAAANNSSAFMVIHGGQLIREKYWNGHSPSSLIVSKSLAKPITALAIGRAIMLGKVKSLDQPVGELLTEWRGKPQGQILVRHLLDMRSGLLAQGFTPEPTNIWSRAYLHPHHDEIILTEYPLTDPPGSIYEYSNATSELIALVIERTTGRRYAEFIGTEVLKPIGAAGGQVWTNREGGLAHSGCCALLPAETYARLAMLVAQDGTWAGKRLLPTGYVGQMKTGTPQNPHYGLGLWLAGDYIQRRGFANASRPAPKVLHSEPYRAADTVMFDGNSNQIVYIVPSQNLIILRTGESPPRQPEWDNSKLINLILSGLKTDTPLVAQK